VAALGAAISGVLMVGPMSAASSSRPRTPGHLYWSEPVSSRGPGGTGINKIWRANVNGTGVERNFVGRLQIPGAVATGASYVYWSDPEAGTIGRARTSGTHANRSLVRANADALAVTRTGLYWTTGSFSGRAAAIWRANLDGTHGHRVVSIGAGTYIGGLAIDSSYLYWSNRDKGTIGRAKLNGTDATLRFIVGVRDPTGLAVNRRHLYWASTVPGSSDSIGRADLDGRNVNHHFITGAAYPYGVAVGGGHLYWANYAGGTIGRADLSGGHVQQSFINAHVFYDVARPAVRGRRPLTRLGSMAGCRRRPGRPSLRSRCLRRGRSWFPGGASSSSVIPGAMARRSCSCTAGWPAAI
jgi:virginiamycin B lyase